MRYASTIIKAVCLILISILFILFLLFASSFGSDENMADLAMSNVLVSAMILVLIVSALSSLAFDYYEKNKYQNEEIFAELKQKIAGLERLEDRVDEITVRYGEKMAVLENDLSLKIAENTSKFEEYMRQFASLSVQVFAKDRQAENMEHGERVDSIGKIQSHGDYFNHYTIPNADVESEIVDDLGDKPEILSLDDKVDISLENFDNEPENPEKKEALPSELIDDILNDKSDEKTQSDEDKLSTIFNDELADTLAGLEIMQDDKENTSKDIDLDKYFSGEEKIKL